MPRYITVAPTFNPLSIDDYLKVPLAIDERYRQEEDKLNSYKDNISLIRNWLGDDAKDLFKDYDDMMSSLASDPSYRNMTDIGSRLKNSYRDIASKYLLAKENRDKYQSMLDKDPSLIGDIGTPYEWFQNPNRNPGFISGKDLDAQIGTLTAEAAKTVPSRATGQYFGDKSNKQEYYITGISPEELDMSLLNAVNGTPTSQYEAGIRSYLNSVNFDSQPKPTQRRILGSIRNAMRSNSGYGSTVVDGLALESKRANIASTKASTARAWQAYNENKPTEWTGADGVRYRSKKSGSGILVTKITPKGEIPAPYYTDEIGQRYDATDVASGYYGRAGKSGSDKGPTLKYIGPIYLKRSPASGTDKKKGKRYSFSLEDLTTLPENASRVQFEIMDEETFNSWINTNKEELEQLFSNKRGSTKELYENMFNYEFYETPDGLIVQPK